MNRNEIYNEISRIKTRAVNIEYLLDVGKWDDAIQSAQGAIYMLERIKRYAGEKRNGEYEKTVEEYGSF
ncbi:MAG: hypothetical protein LBP76_06615 [Treponema sp.]|nr:hypothetical protein [Treponema sp.]